MAHRAERGIVILAVARPAYAAAALNLALSIKHHNPSLEITLLSDGTHRSCFLEPDYAVFDAVDQLASEDYTSDGSVCPAKAKLSLHRYSRYARTLYVDADSLCCGNLDPLFDQLEGSHFFVTFYGNPTSTRYELQTWYDVYLSALCACRGIDHRFTVGDIIANKHDSTLPGAGLAADGRAC